MPSTPSRLNSLGSNIKRALDKSGHSQQDLADYLKKDKGHISRWCNNLVRPNSTSLQEISDFTGYSVTEILTGDFKDERLITKKPRPEGLSQYAQQEIDSIMSFVELLLKEVSGTFYQEPEEEHLKELFTDKIDVLRGKIESLYKLTD